MGAAGSACLFLATSRQIGVLQGRLSIYRVGFCLGRVFSGWRAGLVQHIQGALALVLAFLRVLGPARAATALLLCGPAAGQGCLEGRAGRRRETLIANRCVCLCRQVNGVCVCLVLRGTGG